MSFPHWVLAFVGALVSMTIGGARLLFVYPQGSGLVVFQILAGGLGREEDCPTSIRQAGALDEASFDIPLDDHVSRQTERDERGVIPLGGHSASARL